MIKTVEMDFEYMNYIPKAPVKPEEQYKQACSSDGVTVNSWHKTWVENTAANKKRYGSFAENSIGKLWGKHELSPIICQGSGPSLANNIKLHRKEFTWKWHLGEEQRSMKIPIIACLHNYHYNEDNGVYPDYYVSLDAGEITLEEISKCGKRTHEEYLESTKDKTLLAYIGSSPRLLESWKGEILFFNCPVPSKEVNQEIKNIEEFNCFVSSGGNVLGACVYIAKAFFGCNPIAFTGADFCFSYTKKFHPWDDPRYKEVGNAMRAIDVYGNKVLTWGSYFNFKNFFDWMSQTVDGIYYNCTEGGILGAFPEGNLSSIRQSTLSNFIRMYTMHLDMKNQALLPNEPNNYILY